MHDDVMNEYVSLKAKARRQFSKRFTSLFGQITHLFKEIWQIEQIFTDATHYQGCHFCSTAREASVGSKNKLLRIWRPSSIHWQTHSLSSPFFGWASVNRAKAIGLLISGHCSVNRASSLTKKRENVNILLYVRTHRDRAQSIGPPHWVRMRGAKLGAGWHWHWHQTRQGAEAGRNEGQTLLLFLFQIGANFKAPYHFSLSVLLAKTRLLCRVWVRKQPVPFLWPLSLPGWRGRKRGAKKKIETLCPDTHNCDELLEFYFSQRAEKDASADAIGNCNLQIGQIRFQNFF